MTRFLVFVLLFILSGCYSVETSSTHDREFSWGRSHSKPIYLSFKDTKTTPFYFMLSRDSKESDYKLLVRWKNSRKGDKLFNGYDTTLKFLVDKVKIYTFKPSVRPKIMSYNFNSTTHEEEGIFSISEEVFRESTYAKTVSVELNGRYNTVMADFNKRNTFKAFKEFLEKSY